MESKTQTRGRDKKQFNFKAMSFVSVGLSGGGHTDLHVKGEGECWIVHATPKFRPPSLRCCLSRLFERDPTRCWAFSLAMWEGLTCWHWRH